MTRSNGDRSRFTVRRRALPAAVWNVMSWAMLATTESKRLDVWRGRSKGCGPLALLVVAVLLYLPSLGGGFLPYDDDWLIERNPLLEAPAGEALWAIFFDFSRQTRLTLGAEYLPLRDFGYWCQVALFGKNALGMRLVQLGLYAGALTLFWDALHRRLPTALARVAVVCFALHPTHVESVAWLAGFKDVLSLLFIGAALACYTRAGRVRCWAIPLLMAAALSKSMSVICPGLLLAMDCLSKRRPAWAIVAGSALGVGLVLAFQLKVGAAVGMVGGPLGDSRAVAFLTMGEVWVRYLQALVLPSSLSITYEVTPRAELSMLSVFGWGLALGSLAYAMSRAVRGETFALGVALWAWLPLLPVSHVVFPLQNVMADRYLWLTSLALGLVLGRAWPTHARVDPEREEGGQSLRRAIFHSLRRFRPLQGGAVIQAGIVLWVAVFALGTAERSALFGDPAALFADASGKSPGARAFYQLGYALEAQGEAQPAIDAYRNALAVECEGCPAQRHAANNLARLLVTRGEPHLAESVLRRGLEQFPDDPKTAFNLVKVLSRVGKLDEARALFDATRARHPTYDPARPGTDVSRETLSVP